MKFFVTFSFILVVCASCAQSQGSTIKIPTADKAKPSINEAVATFSEGCFWHTEIVFQSLLGVRDAVSGYAGGTDKRPDYEKVSDGGTGHAESVNVYYDPSKISFETLVKAFFASHDPTQINRQGPDVGPQYRSIAFYRNNTEKAIIEAEIKRINDSGIYSKKVATEVKPFTAFYPAEDYHQEYIINHPGNPYVQNVSIRDYEHFRKTFKGPFKNE